MTDVSAEKNFLRIYSKTQLNNCIRICSNQTEDWLNKLGYLNIMESYNGKTAAIKRTISCMYTLNHIKSGL